MPYVELVDAIPGTVWTPAPGNAAHHLGFFVDDLWREAAELAAAGFEREVVVSMAASPGSSPTSGPLGGPDRAG